MEASGSPSEPLAPRAVGHVPLFAADAVQSLQEPRANEAVAALPTPSVPAPYRMPLSSVAKDTTDMLTFHVIGDSGGIVDPNPQKAVAAALAKYALPSDAFVYHVGDIAYFNGEDGQWFPQFYEPYDIVPLPFLGIPGNHDGAVLPGASPLQAFMLNMCSPKPVLTADAGDAHRDAMTQPYCYWTLTANLVTIIGLYTNVPSGGVVDATQAAWLAEELKDAPTDRPVIVALHHPPYSADAAHGGSTAMGKVIDDAATLAGRWPDMVLSGHVHDYQRFTRTIHFVDGSPSKAIPYIVCGASGYHNLHPLASDVGKLPWVTPDADVVLDAAVDHLYGFLTLTVSAGKITGSYTTVDKTGAVGALTDTF